MPKRSALHELLARTETAAAVPCPAVFLNETKNEVLSLGAQIEVPRISVKKVEPETVAGAVEAIMNAAPGFFRGHSFLEQPYPAAETHFLHFVRPVKGLRMDFIHMLKLDFRFASDMGTNHRDGTADFYPSYSTDRVLYKSLLIPVSSVDEKDGAVISFTPSRVAMNESVEADRFRMAHTIFDEFDPTEFNERIHENIEADIFPVSHRIYPFIEYGYFTIMMRIPDPEPGIIDRAVNLFEPLYTRLQCVLTGQLDCDASSAYPDDLVMHGGLLIESDAFRARAKEFFSRYLFSQNDELALKRWRRLDVKA